MSSDCNVDQERVREFGITKLEPLLEHDLQRHYHASYKDKTARFLIFRRCRDDAALARGRQYVKDQGKVQQIAILHLLKSAEFENDDGSVDICCVFSSYRASLSDDLQLRANKNARYDEDFIKSQLFVLIAVLAEMQRKEVVHRNVTPFSLYLTNTGLKLGEIGSTPKEVTDMRLAGCAPFYLSPMKRQMEKTSKWLCPNPYRSDIFSLGACFLSMVLLRSPRFDDPVTLRESINSEIADCGASEGLKTILRQMLTYDECQRPDFIQMENHLTKMRGEISKIAPSRSAPSLEDIDRLAITIPRKKLDIDINTVPELKLVTITRVSASTEEEEEEPAATMQTEDIRCMFCSTMKITEPASPEEFERPVRLYCNPEHHLFCSRKCFTEFARANTTQWKTSLASLRCRMCQSPIDESLSIEALGGRRQYEKLAASPMLGKCVYCKIESQAISMSCNHTYCQGCLSMLENLPGDFVLCKECETPLLKTEIRKQLPSVLKKFLNIFR